MSWHKIPLIYLFAVLYSNYCVVLCSTCLLYSVLYNVSLYLQLPGLFRWWVTSLVMFTVNCQELVVLLWYVHGLHWAEQICIIYSEQCNMFCMYCQVITCPHARLKWGSFNWVWVGSLHLRVQSWTAGFTTCTLYPWNTHTAAETYIQLSAGMFSSLQEVLLPWTTKAGLPEYREILSRCRRLLCP